MGKCENEMKVKEIYDVLKTALKDMIALEHQLNDRLKEVEERVIRMERAYDALGRRLEGSERHVEDEGWFD